MIAIERSVDDATAAMIEAVAREAGDEDGVPPLGEQPMRSLRSDDGQGVRHLLIRGDGGGVVGYAQLAGEGGDATAEMVVAPPGAETRGRFGTGAHRARVGARRRGVGAR